LDDKKVYVVPDEDVLMCKTLTNAQMIDMMVDDSLVDVHNVILILIL